MYACIHTTMHTAINSDMHSAIDSAMDTSIQREASYTDCVHNPHPPLAPPQGRCKERTRVPKAEGTASARKTEACGVRQGPASPGPRRPRSRKPGRAIRENRAAPSCFHRTTLPKTAGRTTEKHGRGRRKTTPRPRQNHHMPLGKPRTIPLAETGHLCQGAA